MLVWNVNLNQVPNQGRIQYFPWGARRRLGRGAAYDFAKISKKLHENEKILGRRGGGVPP